MTTADVSPTSRRSTEIAVRVAHVSKSFGAVTAVNDLSLSIAVGSVFGLIGPNGAGKTTTFSMLAGYLAPTSGEVEVLGFRPRNVEALRGRLGVLPQDAMLPVSDRVGEFLMHAARLQDLPADRVERSAREVLDDVDGRDWWSLRCGALSHGMAKRVALAQALLGQPEVLLLDEPTAGLDPKLAFEVRQLVKSRRGRATLVISSHNLHELEEICDAAAILDRGRLVATGSMSELTAASQEVRIAATPAAGAPGLPLGALREIPGVTQVLIDDASRAIVLLFDRSLTDAEGVIGAALWILLQQQARISAVSKGRGLEQRVMELT